MVNKSIILSVLFCFSGLMLAAQTFDSTRIYPVPIGNYWGYINYNGEVVIEPTYDYAKPFSYNNQSAIVKKGKYYGIIDIKGKVVVPTTYNSLERNWSIKDEQGHLYTGSNGYKQGVINIKNEVVIPFEYDGMKAAHGCFIVVKNKQYGLLNAESKTLIPVEYKRIKSLSYSKGLFMAKAANKKWAIFDTTGRQIVAPLFDYPNVNFTNKYLNGLSNSEPITIDYDGNIQGELTMKVSKFYKKSKTIARDSTNRYGIVNQDFKWVLKPKYKALLYDVYSKNSEIVIFLEGEHWGLLNLKGERLIEPQYQAIDYISEELIAVSEDGDDYRILNWKTKEWLTDESYTQCRGNARTKTIMVNSNAYNSESLGKWGLLSIDGNIILEPKYDLALDWGDIIDIVVDRGLNVKGIYSIAKKDFILAPVFSAIDYSTQHLCRVTYGLAHENKTAYFRPDGSLVWSAANFDPEKLMEDYYKNKNDPKE